jgi:SOS response regulatory protein OraA/RecX
MVRVHLSDGSFFLLHAEAAARIGLSAGSELDDDQRRRLVARSDRIRARIAALRLLSRSAHTRRGLGQKLAARGFDRTAIRHALARMVELGYCDDRAFAESWAGLRLSRGSIGATALYRGLVARGVPKPLAQEVVSGMYPHEAELDAARRLAVGLSRDAAVRRLAARGFRARAIAAALREIPGTAREPSAD